MVNTSTVVASFGTVIKDGQRLTQHQHTRRNKLRESLSAQNSTHRYLLASREIGAIPVRQNIPFLVSTQAKRSAATGTTVQLDRHMQLTDPDARSMTSSRRGTGTVGYNMQAAVDAEHHLIVAHDVTNVGNDRAQLSTMATKARDALGTQRMTTLADRGYLNAPEILACEQAGIVPLVPKPLTSNSKAEGRFDKRDFVYDPDTDDYECPAGERAIHRFATEENGLTLHKYWSSACPRCPMKAKCTTAGYRRITRWEHEHVLETMQVRLDATPQAAVARRQTVEHVFGTLKARLGTTPLLTKTLPRVRTEISLAVLASNMKRMIKIIGTQSMMRAIAA